MTENKYKSNRIIDGKPIKVIVDDNGNIINKTPTKEELKGLEDEIYVRHIIPKTYNDTNTCDRCREKGIETKLIPGDSHREYINNKFSGKFLCRKCGNKSRYNNDYKYRYDSHNNIKKMLRQRRTGSLDPNSEQAKGDLFEELTCIWRSTVSTIPVENLNKKYDNYEYHIDHSRDSELGIIQTKGSLFHYYVGSYGGWSFGNFDNDIYKEFDNTICYCLSKDGKYVERIYIFPKSETILRNDIAIVKNPTKIVWYKKYRIIDENVLKQVNEILQKIISKK